jgi:hypothetical protein
MIQGSERTAPRNHYITAPFVISPIITSQSWTLPRRFIPTSAIEYTQEHGRTNTDVLLSNNARVLQSDMTAKLFLTDRSKQNPPKLNSSY